MGVSRLSWSQCTRAETCFLAFRVCILASATTSTRGARAAQTWLQNTPRVCRRCSNSCGFHRVLPLFIVFSVLFCSPSGCLAVPFLRFLCAKQQGHRPLRGKSLKALPSGNPARARAPWPGKDDQRGRQEPQAPAGQPPARPGHRGPRESAQERSGEGQMGSALKSPGSKQIGGLPFAWWKLLPGEQKSAWVEAPNVPSPSLQAGRTLCP